MHINLYCTGWIKTHLIILSTFLLVHCIFYIYMYSRYGRYNPPQKNILQEDERYKGKYAL